jgi:hypothetical protein
MFWTPAFAGVTLQETFYEIIKNALNKILILKNEEPEAKKSQKPLTDAQKNQSTVTTAKTGVQNSLKRLDSGFRRDYDAGPSMTFSETC